MDLLCSPIKAAFSIFMHFKMYFIPLMAKLNFQQSLVSPRHDPSEINLMQCSRNISSYYQCCSL